MADNVIGLTTEIEELLGGPCWKHQGCNLVVTYDAISGLVLFVHKTTDETEEENLSVV